MKALRIKQVMEMTGLSKATVWKWTREGKFPKSFQLDTRVTVWDEADINAWLENKKGEGDGDKTE